MDIYYNVYVLIVLCQCSLYYNNNLLLYFFRLYFCVTTQSALAERLHSSNRIQHIIYYTYYIN